jgi:hypothetical protein
LPPAHARLELTPALGGREPGIKHVAPPGGMAGALVLVPHRAQRGSLTEIKSRACAVFIV